MYAIRSYYGEARLRRDELVDRGLQRAFQLRDLGRRILGIVLERALHAVATQLQHAQARRQNSLALLQVLDAALLADHPLQRERP